MPTNDEADKLSDKLRAIANQIRALASSGANLLGIQFTKNNPNYYREIAAGIVSEVESIRNLARKLKDDKLRPEILSTIAGIEKAMQEIGEWGRFINKVPLKTKNDWILGRKKFQDADNSFYSALISQSDAAAAFEIEQRVSKGRGGRKPDPTINRQQDREIFDLRKGGIGFKEIARRLNIGFKDAKRGHDRERHKH